MNIIEMFLILGAIGLFLLVGTMAFQESITDYKMPNGVICESIIYGDAKTFMQCSDGKKYINPEFYREIKK